MTIPLNHLHACFKENKHPITKHANVDQFFTRNDSIISCTKKISSIFPYKHWSILAGLDKECLLSCEACMTKILTYGHALLHVTYVYNIHLSTSPFKMQIWIILKAKYDWINSCTKRDPYLPHLVQNLRFCGTFRMT